MKYFCLGTSKVVLLIFVAKIKTMKKSVLIIGLSILSSGIMFPQAFKKETPSLNVGIGLAGHLAYWGPGYSATPYINAAFDYGVFDFPEVKNLSIGLGGYIGFRSVSHTWGDAWMDKNGNIHYNEPVKRTWTYTALGIRPTVHYSFDDKAEIYAGTAIGYVIVNYKYSHPDFYASSSYGSYFGWGIFGGGRYYFTNSFGLFAEFGYAISYVNLGVSFKFK